MDYGKTEVIDNNLNPKWVKHFIVEYYTDSQQHLLFEVWDDDDIEGELIGRAEMLMQDVMMAPKQTFCCALVHKKVFRGTLKIRAILQALT